MAMSPGQNATGIMPPTDVDVVDLREQADASMPASNNNVNHTIDFNF